MKAKHAAGADLLVKTVHQLTGVPIDHFVQVSLLGFVRISDAIGNVTINLCHSVDDTVAHNLAEGNGRVGSGFKMSKGIHHIHGVQALEFVRQRHNLPGIGDYGRAARQRYFLTAALRHVTDASILLDVGKLRRLIDAVKTSVYADDGLNVLEFAKQLSQLSANNIVGHAIKTARYADVTIYGTPANVGIVHPSQVRRYVRGLFTPHAAPTPRAPTPTRHPAARRLYPLTFTETRDDGRVTEHDANLARDHLANERTFLAWLRTAAAVMALGLAVAGLAHRVTAISAVAGCLLVATGVTGVFYATVRYRKVTRDLDNGVYTPGGRGSASIVAASVLAIAVVTALVLILVGQY